MEGQVPTIGRIVQVCIDTGDKPQWRPAIVVQDWGAQDDTASIKALWLSSITKGEGLRQWRWPPRT